MVIMMPIIPIILIIHFIEIIGLFITSPISEAGLHPWRFCHRLAGW
jgi:hypothetical protein